MDEFELIGRLTTRLAHNSTVVVGAGDDCAVLDLGLENEWILFKTDAVVEAVHYPRDAAPEQVGHKALARCLSDIAAMAGEPSSALVTIGLPRDFRAERVEALYEGLNALARKFGVAVVGGETTLVPGNAFVSVSVIGRVSKARCILRSGALPGDGLFVTGELGGSLAGRHLTFEPRLREARWLADRYAVRGMIDLSDGLAGDLRCVLEASHAGAELLPDAIPVSRAARERARAQSPAKPALEAALTDGEDFELLFCAGAGQAVRLLREWREAFPDVRLSCIGKVTREPGIRLRDRGGQRPLAFHGYTHFAKS